MRKIISLVGRMSVALMIGLSVLFAGHHAFATDRVTLKEGTRVVEGEIVREVDGFIWIKYSVGAITKEEMFRPDQISKVEKAIDAAGEKKADTAAAATPATKPDEKKPSRPGVPKGAIITLGERGEKDMVGVYMTAHTLKEALPLLKQDLGTDGSGVVVFRVYSGGGLLLEIQKLSDVIQEEYKKNFRVVGWIESAISAAAMTAHCMEEIYFTSQANYGACTGWHGQLVAVKGADLERVLQMMERISARGQHDKLIMRSMQIQDPLSATIDPDGTVHFYPDVKSGEIIVNREGEILTLNAKTAEQIKFSRGTADTLDELSRLMGYQEIEWTGDKRPGFMWPISRAEQMQLDYRRQVHEDQQRLNEYFANYQMQLQAAASAPRPDRPPFVGRARATLNKFKQMVRLNPNFALLQFNSQENFDRWYDEQDRRLKELLK